MSKNKHQKDMQRRLSTRDARRVREEMLAELSDPARYAEYLRVFSHLALLHPALRPCRFPGEAFVANLIAAPPPEAEDIDERIRALRQAVIPSLVDAELLNRCQVAIQTTLGGVDDRDQILAVTAAGALATSCLEAGVPSQHPFWDVLFEVTLTEAILSSLFLQRLVHSGLSVDTAQVGQVFARALAQGELGDELGRLGLEDPSPESLAKRYAELVEDRNPHNFQFDAVLHLSLAHVEESERIGRSLARTGLTSELKQGALARYEEAYQEDVNEGLIQEVCDWYRGHLEAMRDRPDEVAKQLPRPLEEERERSLVCYLAMRTIPQAESALLRAIHVQSLSRARLGVAPDEEVFVGKLWSDPADMFALEEYEKYLLAKQDKTRSRRVRRFREALRKRKAEAANQAATEGQTASDE